MTWAVAKVPTRMEIKLAEQIQGAYCPISKVKKRPSGRRWKYTVEEEAAFKGYIFVSYSLILDAIAYLQSHGVLHVFLKSSPEAESWAVIEDDVIDALRHAEKRGEFDGRYKVANEQHRIGEAVRVPQGPWGGMTGFVTRTRKDFVYVGGGDFEKEVRFPDAHVISLDLQSRKKSV